MIFSLFGKRKEARDQRARSRAARDGEPTTTQSTTAATNTVSQREIARRTAAKIDAIESEMDMSIPAKVAKPAAEPIAGGGNEPVTPARKDPAPVYEGDMAVYPAPEPRQKGTPPKAGGRTPPPPDPKPGLEPSTSMILGDTYGAADINVLSSGLLPVFEEASVLYANKQSSAAAMILWQAIKDNRLGTLTDQGWKMLFELYQAGGRKPEFESLALDYASRFESSPPAWQDELAPEVDAPPPIARKASAIAFPETLDVQAIKQVEQIQRAIQRGRPAAIDFSQVRRGDEIGAETVLRALAEARKNNGQLNISGVDELRVALARSIEVGRRDASDACWLLLLETLRFLGQQQAFEDLAIDYCVTYEVSPPSWEPLPDSIKITSGPDADTEAPAEEQVAEGEVPDHFELSGEIDGRPHELLAALKVYSQHHQEVVVDCRRLRRIDFTCAGEILNEVAAMRSAGKFVAFRELSYLIACLMMVMGIQDLAELKVRAN